MTQSGAQMDIGSVASEDRLGHTLQGCRPRRNAEAGGLPEGTQQRNPDRAGRRVEDPGADPSPAPHRPHQAARGGDLTGSRDPPGGGRHVLRTAPARQLPASRPCRPGPPAFPPRPLRQRRAGPGSRRGLLAWRPPGAGGTPGSAPPGPSLGLMSISVCAESPRALGSRSDFCDHAGTPRGPERSGPADGGGAPPVRLTGGAELGNRLEGR
ncbi:basic proline-rich protein-like [Hyaena hyaena]|uniref:basic proline-rich protein-like n=1 Tax=Hyaena hyaena TaxID=95912 RepID=UPI001923A0E7|nr:basic proline-rich protein-like [Hyaena hyaena]